MIEFNPKVSIVIPVYMGPNYKKTNYLREAIDSALAQTYKNIEVLVVNDGSDDGGKTEEIAKSYGDKIRYFYKENGGVASALNLGLREMTGEYFSWLSHDDVYLPEKIDRQIQIFKKKDDKNVITFSDFECIDENSKVISSERIDMRHLKNIYLTILSTSIHGCSLLIPRQCFEKVGLFNEYLRTTQDNEMWLRIAKAGFRFEYIPEILLRNRLHQEQVSNVKREVLLKDTEAFYIWAVDMLHDDISEMCDEVLEILLNKRCFAAFDKLLRSKSNLKISKYYYMAKKYYMKLLKIAL